MRVVVGRIGRAQGIRGEVTVEVRTDSPEERFATGAVLLPTGRAGLPDEVRCAGHRWQGGRLVLSLEGVEDRTAAETLRGAILETDVELVAGEDDEYHDLALVGLRAESPDGAAVGTVAEVLHLPGQDVLAVARPDAPELLVPFVRAMVPTVDLERGRVVLDLPAGLAELAEPPDAGVEPPAAEPPDAGA
ncbi:MAG: ribosome maturation factor RimM [Candidatus Nanopelagicales bacterium]|jgi:16S rRNA processing protein RimM|nr:ribosome maturation factor RimM [Candidatus Nanopelagicales bacterium]